MKSTHRNRLPYTSTNFDTWDALIDVDIGFSTDTVRLIYKEADVSSLAYGTSDTWNREHLWPKSLGVGSSGYDYTDIHALRPSDWNVNAARGNKFFGECGVADVQADCRVGHPEALLTETDNVVWSPPSEVRGDIARAMFYMTTRYYGDADGNDPDLQLVDCPNATNTNELAYLSVMLKWHAEDPVSEREKARNDRVCSSWQGNRNPFVDHPELVQQIFGFPRAQPVNGEGYDCSIPPDSPSPTSSPTSSPSSAPTSSPTSSPTSVSTGATCSSNRCDLCTKIDCQNFLGCEWSGKNKACIGTSNPATSSPTAVGQCSICPATGQECCGVCVSGGKPKNRGCFNRRNLRG